LLTFTTLASGSSGNAALVSCGDTHILLDAGISARRITGGLKALGVSPEKLTAICITHEHTDHISGLPVLEKKLHVPIVASGPTCQALCHREPSFEELVREQEPGTGVQLGSLWVESFATLHDAEGSVGYAVTGDNCRVVLCTDLGYVTQGVFHAATDCDLLVCETNHDEEWVRSGPYPHYLKQRILGDYGHLSNEAGAELCAQAVLAGTRAVVLAHLSEQNNTPAHARQVVEQRLREAGIDPERDLSLAVAPRGEAGQLYRLEQGRGIQAIPAAHPLPC
jgi:phosphoribosyl 1,2-cyclic phosphodiesterase